MRRRLFTGMVLSGLDESRAANLERVGGWSGCAFHEAGCSGQAEG